MKSAALITNEQMSRTDGNITLLSLTESNIEQPVVIRNVPQ